MSDNNFFTLLEENKPLIIGGWVFPRAIEFEDRLDRAGRRTKERIGVELNQATGEPFYVLPGGRRATEREIRRMF